MESFAFDELTFITSLGEPEEGINEERRAETLARRPFYPELRQWSTFAFFVAWGAYSQDVYAVGWVDWQKLHRDDGFPAYCYVCQRWPGFDFGGTGLFDEETRAFGAQMPWALSPLPPAPSWVGHHG